MVVGALLIDFAKLGSRGELNVAIDHLTWTGSRDYEGQPRPDNPLSANGSRNPRLQRRAQLRWRLLSDLQ